MGRKLLLADDSITIQKVVDLTFADEGIKVVSVSDGKEAIEKLHEMTPDIVLADIFMPKMSGYEVCEYIKKNDELKHIPVILLVGSFEPFDEAEARRVGADDTLTKPFQSIRRLIDKVAGLIGGRPEEAVAVAELPQPQERPEAPEESVVAAEVEPGDTQPLTQDTGAPLVESETAVGSQHEEETASSQNFASETRLDGQSMQSPVSQMQSGASVAVEEAGEVLLDLGELESTSEVSSPDDFVLDLDFDGPYEPAHAESSYAPTETFVASQSSQPTISEARTEAAESGWATTAFDVGEEAPEFTDSSVMTEAALADDTRLAATQEWVRVSDEPEPPIFATESEPSVFTTEPKSPSLAAEPEPPTFAAEPELLAPAAESVAEITEPVRPAGQITLDQLSPEVIDAIARRAVEQLSEKVVQEIAWEVVPQLAELLIKRRLEEKESQTP